MKHLAKRLLRLLHHPTLAAVESLHRVMESQALRQGEILRRLNRTLPENIPLDDAEFSVFSQHGQDGIIDHLCNHLKDLPPTFVEFGSADYGEANTRFLLWSRHWSGLLMDGSSANIQTIRNRPEFWKFRLQATQALVTAENINELLRAHGIGETPGLLSVDIDGNDYWVWRALDHVKPVVVVCEFNPAWGSTLALTIPYQPDFDRWQVRGHGIYFGASLPALVQLAQAKGYDYIGRTSMGNDAFFVRSDWRQRHLPALQNLRVDANPGFTESRDPQGRLNHLRGPAALRQIKGLPLVHLDSGEVVPIGSGLLDLETGWGGVP